MPRYVGTVRALNICGDNSPIQNQWYRFLPRECNYGWNGWGAGMNGGWWGTSSWGRWCGNTCTSVANGTTQTFDSIRGEGRLIRAYMRCNADEGRTVRIYGIDNNGQTLMTRDASDNYSEGITLTLTKPFVSSSVFVRRIDRIVKDATQCPINLYAYWAAEDALEPIAQYDGAETVPEYQRMSIHGCCGLKSVTALVKLKFIPVINDDDFVIIENLDALKLMIQSQDYSDAGNLQAANAYELDAIRELNRQLGDESPLDQLPVQVRPFNSTGIGRQKCF